MLNSMTLKVLEWEIACQATHAKISSHSVMTLFGNKNTLNAGNELLKFWLKRYYGKANRFKQEFRNVAKYKI